MQDADTFWCRILSFFLLVEFADWFFDNVSNFFEMCMCACFIIVIIDYLDFQFSIRWVQENTP